VVAGPYYSFLFASPSEHQGKWRTQSQKVDAPHQNPTDQEAAPVQMLTDMAASWSYHVRLAYSVVNIYISSLLFVNIQQKSIHVHSCTLGTFNLERFASIQAEYPIA
jgi:hypothetical protein